MPIDTAHVRMLLRQGNFGTLFNEMGWDRNTRFLPVSVVELGVTNPRTFHFQLTGIAQKRGAQVFLCLPDEYGLMPGQHLRRLIQAQVVRTAHHNIIIFADADREMQVWQWAEWGDGHQTKRVFEHQIIGEATQDFLHRLVPFTFSLEDEARLTLADVASCLKTAFSEGHKHIEKGRHKRKGLGAYDLTKVDKGLRFWWERVLREPYLTKEEEYSIACAMRNGNLEALDLMLRAHLHLIARIAWRLAERHSCSIEDYLDLVQTGNVEMIRLAPGFDPDGGVRFQTYLTPRILKTLGRALADEEGLIRLPHDLLDTMQRVDKRRLVAEESLAQQLGRFPYEDEVSEVLAAEFQIPVNNVMQFFSIRAEILSWDILAAEWEAAMDDEASGNLPPGRDNPEIEIFYGAKSPSTAAVDLIRREQLDDVLGKLTPRERDVIRMRYGLDDGNAHTLEEVGQRFFVTTERIRQIELRALKKLRRIGPVDI